MSTINYLFTHWIESHPDLVQSKTYEPLEIFINRVFNISSQVNWTKTDLNVTFSEARTRNIVIQIAYCISLFDSTVLSTQEFERHLDLWDTHNQGITPNVRKISLVIASYYGMFTYSPKCTEEDTEMITYGKILRGDNHFILTDNMKYGNLALCAGLSGNINVIEKICCYDGNLHVESCRYDTVCEACITVGNNSVRDVILSKCTPDFQARHKIVKTVGFHRNATKCDVFTSMFTMLLLILLMNMIF